MPATLLRRAKKSASFLSTTQSPPLHTPPLPPRNRIVHCAHGSPSRNHKVCAVREPARASVPQRDAASLETSLLLADRLEGAARRSAVFCRLSIAPLSLSRLLVRCAIQSPKPARSARQYAPERHGK